MTERFSIKKQLSARRSADGFLAYDTLLRTDVRLRRIHSPLTPQQLATFNDQFQVTKRQLSLIKSDLVLSILDVGIDSEGAWIALPYYDNKQLLKFQSLPIPLDEFHNLAAQTLSALIAIHDKNLVHGALTANSIDVIPATTENGRNTYMIRDLGMRRLLVLAQNKVTLSSLPSDVAILAPELFQEEDALPESDLYMAGQLFYYLLAGGHPLVGCSAEDAEKRHHAHDFPSLHQADKSIPVDLSNWIDQLTQADPLKRPRSAKEALKSLPEISLSSPVAPSEKIHRTKLAKSAKSAKSKKLPILIGSALLIIALISAFTLSLKNDKSPQDPQTPPKPKAEASLKISITPFRSYLINGLLKNYSPAKIGTNARASNLWGHEKTASAKGPDLGSTGRAAYVFKIADIIDASSTDSIENVTALTHLTLRFQLTSKTPKSSITPLVHYAGSLNDYRPARLKKEIIKVRKGEKGLQDGQVYTFVFNNIDLSDAGYSDYIVFFILCQRTAKKGDYMSFDEQANTLTIEK